MKVDEDGRHINSERVKFIMLSFVSLFLVSCAAKLTQPQPRPKNAKALIVQAMEYKLKDPNSADYKFQEPFLGKTGRGQQWVMNFAINSKNSFGGYTGYQRWFAAFIDGTSVDYTMSYSENPLLGLIKPVAQ